MQSANCNRRRGSGAVGLETGFAASNSEHNLRLDKRNFKGPDHLRFATVLLRVVVEGPSIPRTVVLDRRRSEFARQIRRDEGCAGFITVRD